MNETPKTIYGFEINLEKGRCHNNWPAVFWKAKDASGALNLFPGEDHSAILLEFLNRKRNEYGEALKLTMNTSMALLLLTLSEEHR